MNFSVICSNIPAAPAYRIYISLLIRYECDSCHDYLDRWWLLIRKLLNQWFLVFPIWSNHFEIFTSPLLPTLLYICFTNDHDIFRMYLITIYSAFMTYHQVYKKSSTMGATCGAGITYSSGAPEFTPYISGVRIARSLVLCCSIVFICRFFFLSLGCLFLFDLRLLVILL